MPDNNRTNAIRFVYAFQFDDGTQKTFEILLDPFTLEFLSDKDAPKPEWTELTYHQCEQCPLGKEVKHCPVAVNLSKVVHSFRDSRSFEHAVVTVSTAERNYVKDTTVQKGLSSIVGLIMVTSGCPAMDTLRPMVRFHLPFATALETFYRAVSMYLTAQYFVLQKGLQPDWQLKDLVEKYKAMSKVNKGMSERLSSASHKDANVNAVVILHSFGESVPYLIENGLAEIEHLFNGYIKDIGNSQTE